jgi:LCP family protein required for cell wall assembly
MLLPGAGQLYVGPRRRGLVLLALTALVLAALAALAARGVPALDLRLVAALLALDLALLALRLFAVIDAGRGPATRAALLALAGLAAITAAPHVAAGYITVRAYDVLDTVFASEEPRDVLPSRGLFLTTTRLRPAKPKPLPKGKPLDRSRRVLADGQPAAGRPWTTMLLVGTDEGPGNWGARTDTIILAAIEHGTGRAAAFGIPRNLVDYPLAETAAAAAGYREPLNGLYGFARSRPDLFPVGRDPGATALKHTVSLLLGVRVDYYALVNLRGFADLVDALGPIRIEVKERLVDSVTRPAWGEPKPRIDVHPGRTYSMYGRQALAYVRSRKSSSDYTRMARQRCFLSAMADQLDPIRVLRNFPRVARTVEQNVHTDVPLDRLPRLVRLVAAIDPRETLTLTFGPEYFFGRRKSDDFPAPHRGRMRATVRSTLLHPERMRASDGAAVASATC